jgi:SNF2 family DNA or RNA helicase
VRQKSELRPYQPAAVRFIREKKRCGLFVCPGLGKSIITLTAFTEAMEDIECGRVLIIAPPRVAKKTWPDEFAEWAHTKGYSYTRIAGSPAKRRQLLTRATAFHVLSIELLPWLLKELGGHAPDRRRIKQFLEDDKPDEARAANKWRPPTRMPYNAIVVDESSKVKAHNSNRFRALKLMAPRVEYFVILTGTPAANGMSDLWSQIYLLDQGARLGQNITAFRDRWCKENYNGHGYRVQDYAIKIIEERISDIVFTLREEDYANLPPRMYNTIKLEFDEVTKKKYKDFERTYVLKLSEEKNLLVNNGAAITTKLQQLANGVVYDEKKGEHAFHSVKLDALEDLVEELNGDTLLVAYQFKSDVTRILDRFKNAVLFDKDPKTQDRWNEGKIPILLVHPKSAAHGLNLQFGGNTIAWYGMTWSLEDYIQLNKRLHRSGQKKPVMVHHLMVEGTMDEDAMAALAGKNDMQEFLLNALKKRIRLYK